MKNIIIILLFFYALFEVDINAQSFNNEQAIPLKQLDSPLFGKDVTIYNQADQNQVRVSVCSAFNGWLYAAISYLRNGLGSFAIARSTNNGESWDILYVEPEYADVINTKVDIVACGNSLSTLKIFFGICQRFTNDDSGGAWLLRWNGDPFEFEEDILFDWSNTFTDLSIATDFLSPSSNANPYSIGILYSKRTIGSQNKDSIIFRSSSNGGISLDSREVVAITSQYVNEVSLSFGRSPSWDSGRYYAAWETFANSSNISGHIYTAHSSPNFNSSFTTPVCLDSLHHSYINMCKRPRISTQYNSNDNDSANITQLVFCEKRNTIGDMSNILGFYNLQSTGSSHFNSFICTDSTEYNCQPDVDYNPYERKFYLTYFDSLNQLLPVWSKTINMQNSSAWEIISDGYNDISNIQFPYPTIVYNAVEQSLMNVWLSSSENNNGSAMFDAQYSTYTGWKQSNNSESLFFLNVFPNPCNSSTTISIFLKEPSLVRLSITDLFGNQAKDDLIKEYSIGKHNVKLNVDDLSTGMYLFKLNANNCLKSGKLIVIH